jgi:hypothetical protein
VFDLAPEHVSRQRLGGRVGRVEDDEPVRPERRLDPRAEGVSHPDSRPVHRAQAVEQFLRELGVRQRRLERRERLAGRVVEPDASNRPFVRAGWIAERDVLQVQIRIEHAGALHLVPVVILRVDPEDRHGRDAMLGPYALGELDGRERFEQREQRSAEEPGLLSGHDRHRVGIAEVRGCRDGFGRSAAAPLLRLHHVGHRVASADMPLRPRDGIAPGGPVRRVASEEVREPRVVEDVVRRQASNPWKAPDVDGKAGGRAGQR